MEQITKYCNHSCTQKPLSPEINRYTYSDLKIDNFVNKTLRNYYINIGQKFKHT